LAEVLRVRESLPLVEAVELLLTLCQAVSEAHSLQLVYGNLGPENLFVERRPDHPQRLCFVDFGVVASSLQTDTASVARDFEALPHSRELALPGVCSMAQALPYLAPEQFRSPASVDHRADIWALGTLLFEMVAGRPAFMADSDAELRAKVVAARVPDLATLRPELPEAFASTVMACLQVEPWLRPQSVNDLTSMLVLFSARRPTRSSLPAEAPSCNTEAVAAPITLVGHSSPITVVDERFTSRPQLRAPTVSDRTPTFYSLLLPAGVGTRSWPVARAQQRSHPPSATSPWVVALVAALTLMASVLAAMGTSRWLERPIAPPPLPAPVALVPPSDAVVVDVPSRPAPVPGYNAAAVPSKDVPQRVASRRELQPPGQPAPGRKSARVLFGGID
jgi:serine/threonine-protein kinase